MNDLDSKRITMRQPDFFVVGAAKSGTTALWEYFQQHPEIFVTDKIEHKELGYYSNQYGVSNKERYLKFFKKATKAQLIGEVCHVYLTSEESAEWIKNDVPKAKIIIILRNPVERAYSLYNWMVMHGYENSTSFERALKKEKEINNNSYDKSKLLHGFHQNYNYFNSGLYFKQVKKYFDVFGEENVLVIEYEDFKKHTENTLINIFKFLNVKPHSIITDQKVNKSKKVLLICVQYYSRRGLLSKYGKNKIYNYIFKFALKINVINRNPKKINPIIKQKLIANYKKDIDLLSDLTNINFSGKWNEEITFKDTYQER